VKVWVGFLLAIFALACRPGAGRRARPRNLVVAGFAVLTAAALYQYRYI
jgi:hypothetical protein